MQKKINRVFQDFSIDKVSRKTAGLTMGALAGLFWGLNDVCVNIYSCQLNIIDTTILTLIFSLSLSLLQDISSSISILSLEYVSSPKYFFRKILKTKRIIFLLFLAGFCGGPLGITASIMGISYAGAVYSGMITASFPAVALILSAFILKEGASKLKMLGIILSIISTICISISGLENNSSHLIWGMLFALCATLGWGCESVIFSLVLNKKTDHSNSFLLAIRQFFSSLIYLLSLILISVFFQLKP